jgi:hypothetical protein
MAINLGDAILFLKGNNKDLNAKLKGAQQNTERTMESIKSKVRQVGVAMTAVGAGITAMFTSAAKEASAFSEEVGKLASLGVSNLDELTAGAKDAAIAFGQDVTKAVSTMYSEISEGFPEESGVDILNASMKAAIAGAGETQAAFTATSKTMDAYGQKVDDAEKTVSNFTETSGKLVTAVKFGATTIDELGPAVGLASQSFAEAGVTVDEFLASIATVTLSAPSTSQAVTSLRAGLKAFAVPVREMKPVIEAMNVEMGVAAIQTKGWQKTVEDAIKQIEEQNPILIKRRTELEKQVKVLEESGNKTEGAKEKLKEYKEQLKVLNLVGDSAFETLTRILGSVEAAGAVFSIGKTKVDIYAEALKAMQSPIENLNEAFKARMAVDMSIQLAQLEQAMKVLRIEIGTALLPVLVRLSEIIIPIIEKVREWMERNPELTESIVAWTAAAGALMLVLGPIAIILPQIIGLIHTLAVGVAFLGSAFGGILVPISLAAVGIHSLAVMLGSGNWLSNPLTQFIDKYFPLFGRYIDWVMDKMVALVNFIKNTAIAAFEGLQSMATDMLGSVGIDVDESGGVSPGFANGTKRAPRGFALVGEQGPELVNLRGGESVFPTSLTRSLLNAVSGPSQPQPAMVGGGGVNIYMGGVTVKNEADEDRLVRKITNVIDRKSRKLGRRPS